LGASVDAALTLAGLKALLGPSLDPYLSEKGSAIPAGDLKYIFLNGAAALKIPDMK
jgi:hypothetical protein